jgi:hypothetical protein
MQQLLFLKKITNNPRIIGVIISAIFVVLLWFFPLSTRIDVGGIDVPWVSGFYATQQQHDTSYRWSRQQGDILLTGLGGGDYTVRIVMRSVQSTDVQIIVDNAATTKITITNQFHEYMMPLHMPWRSNGEVAVTIQCPQPQMDGKRVVCVAIDAVTVIPQGVTIPPLVPILLMVLWVGTIYGLLWQWVRQWWWWGVLATLLLVLFVGAHAMIVVALPYLVVITGVIGVLHYTATQPLTQFWWVIRCAMWAALITTIRFAFQAQVGLMLEDEGYLWYGSQRMVVGELPMRDFVGYDIPRYIWNALVMIITGSRDIYALRVAIALCEWVTLTFVWVVLTMSHVKWRSVVVWLGLVMVLFWLYPRHKIYDHVVIWFIILAFWWWLVNPTNRRTFWAGIVVGVAAMIGRNHGVYAACIGILLLGYVWWSPMDWRQRIRLALTLGVGVVVGFAPMVLLMVVIPSFGQAYIENARFWLGVGKTNVTLPIPWPWRQTTVYDYLVGLWFVMPAVTYVMTLGVIMWRRWHNATISVGALVTATVGLVYLQVGYSRADMSHLAQGIAPFIALIVVLVFYIPARFQIAVMLVLCGWSAGLNWNSAWQSTVLSTNTNRQEITATNQLTVPNAVANQLALLNAIQQKYNPTNDAFVMTPYVPGIYAILQQPSPLFNPYILFPFDEATQNREISALQRANPRFILIDDRMIDNQKKMRFMVNYPLVDTYIRTHYQGVQDPIVPKNMRLYVPKP